MVTACFMLLLSGGSGAEGQAMTEHQVKALFLLNFAKYVDWPAEAFGTTNSPIVIGVMGDGKLVIELVPVVAGKTVTGRPILIQEIPSIEEMTKCHILFIGTSEKTRLASILNRIKGNAVLAVGETDQFLEQGGMIKFVKKEEKIRLEINLATARRANLRISSRLLQVADVVKGK